MTTPQPIVTALMRVAVARVGRRRLVPWPICQLLWDTRRQATAEARCAAVLVPAKDRPLGDALIVMRYGDFVALHGHVLDRPAREALALLGERHGGHTQT